MKRQVILLFFALWAVCECFCDETDYNVTRIPGFDFGSGDFSTSLDRKVESITEEHKEDSNQIVVGHSQGGLKAIGYMQKMKGTEYQDNIDAVISVDSPIVGFAGLDRGYGAMRNKVLGTLKTFDRGTSGVVYAALGVPFLNQLIYELLPVEWKMNFFIWFYNFISNKNLPMSDLITTILDRSKPSSSIREITDMGRMSDFVQNNIRKTNLEKNVKYKKGKYQTIVFKRKKGPFGIRYWVPKIVTRTKWGYRDIYTAQPSIVPDYAPVGHIVGTENNPVKLAGKKQDKMEDTISLAREMYNWGGHLNVAKSAFSFWFLPKAVLHGMKANDCYKAAAWCRDYKNNWGDLIGGRANDGFITVNSQTLPETPSNYIRTLKVDHVRSNVPAKDKFFGDGDFGGEPMKKKIYGEGGEIASILNDMGLEGF